MLTIVMLNISTAASLLVYCNAILLGDNLWNFYAIQQAIHITAQLVQIMITKTQSARVWCFVWHLSLYQSDFQLFFDSTIQVLWKLYTRITYVLVMVVSCISLVLLCCFQFHYGFSLAKSACQVYSTFSGTSGAYVYLSYTHKQESHVNLPTSEIPVMLLIAISWCCDISGQSRNSLNLLCCKKSVII